MLASEGGIAGLSGSTSEREWRDGDLACGGGYSVGTLEISRAEGFTYSADSGKAYMGVTTIQRTMEGGVGKSHRLQPRSPNVDPGEELSGVEWSRGSTEDWCNGTCAEFHRMNDRCIQDFTPSPLLWTNSSVFRDEV